LRCGSTELRGERCAHADRAPLEVVWTARERSARSRRIWRAAWFVARTLYALPLVAALGALVLALSLAQRALGIEPLLSGSSAATEIVALPLLIGVAAIEWLFIARVVVAGARTRALEIEVVFRSPDGRCAGWVHLADARVVSGAGVVLERRGDPLRGASLSSSAVIGAGTCDVAESCDLPTSMHALAYAVLAGLIVRGHVRAWPATLHTWERRRGRCWREAAETIALEPFGLEPVGGREPPIEAELARLLRKRTDDPQDLAAIDLLGFLRLPAAAEAFWRDALDAEPMTPERAAAVMTELRRFVAENAGAHDALLSPTIEHYAERYLA
jgi:hypothetical protein